MGYHSAESIPITRKLATAFQMMESLARTSGLPRGTVRATVRDVDDPEERGRVRVVFDAFNYKEIPQVEGGGPREGTDEGLSHWIDASPSFKGKQPPGLVGKRVNIVLSNGQYQYAVLQDVVYDPYMLTDEAASKAEIPDNSTMIRLPIYPAGELPLPCKENYGCTVIEEGGPMGSDWMCVCLKRSGNYFWVRHVDLAHGHAGGDDGTQPPCALGVKQNPVQSGTVGCHVFPATAFQYLSNTSFSQRPTGNPFGEDATQPLPPMCSEEFSDSFVELSDFELLGTDSDTAINMVREGSGYLQLDDTISGIVPKWNPEIPILTQPFAIKAFEFAQKAYDSLSIVQKAATDPSFIFNEAISAAGGNAEGDIPPATKAALGALASNPSGLVKTLALSTLTSVGTGILSALKSSLTNLI